MIVLFRTLALLLGIAVFAYLVGTGLILIPIFIVLLVFLYDAIWGEPSHDPWG